MQVFGGARFAEQFGAWLAAGCQAKGQASSMHPGSRPWRLTPAPGGREPLGGCGPGCRLDKPRPHAPTTMLTKQASYHASTWLTIRSRASRSSLVQDAAAWICNRGVPSDVGMGSTAQV